MAGNFADLVIGTLLELRDACHKNSVDHGFWDKSDWNFGEKIALIHSELSEMFEAYRKGIGDHACDKNVKIIDFKHVIEGTNVTGERRITFIEEEIADVIIRVLDLCGKLNIDVGRVVLAKMEYNKGREHMHGGRKC